MLLRTFIVARMGTAVNRIDAPAGQNHKFFFSPADTLKSHHSSAFLISIEGKVLFFMPTTPPRPGPIVSIDGRNLSKVFRTCFDFMARHLPPRLEGSYMAEVEADAEQLLATADTFTTDLIVACCGELGRQVAIMADNADRMPPDVQEWFE